MTSECRERREVEGSIGGPGCRSKHWAQIDAVQRDGFSDNEAVRRGGFGKIRASRQGGVGRCHANRCDEIGKDDADQRDGFSEIRADQRDGFGQNSRRKTCKYREKADETKNACRHYQFFKLTSIESEDGEEVNAVEAVQEIVEITVDSGAAKSIWPSRKKDVERTKSTRAVKLAAATGSPIRVEGDARLEFVRDGKKCSTRFLDVDVKRPVASKSASVDEGNVVVFGQRESFIENTNTGQKVPMCKRNGVFVMRLDAQPCPRAAKPARFSERNTSERTSVLRRPA